MKNGKGKLVAIYGTNGIGKTTQTEKLVEYLIFKGKKAGRLKYPIYDLEPEGPFIYKYLRDPKFRSKNDLSTHELQKKYADGAEPAPALRDHAAVQGDGQRFARQPPAGLLPARALRARGAA
jgi:energy-coupling factor transporter ATP-binding protein EcfA2